MMNIQEFTKKIIDTKGELLGDAFGVRLNEKNNSVAVVTENDDGKTLDPGADIVCAFKTQGGGFGFITTVPLQNPELILGAIGELVDGANEVWRFQYSGADNDMFYVYGRDGMKKISVAGIVTPTLVFGRDWTPQFCGYTPRGSVQRRRPQ